ncbi:Ni/Fe-hydrogenase, b-type cytochrome subunit [bacterium]|nr:MAG: Ni/Fe-hydrogenase, b-type cytochrome subunit [bacterium]
MESVMKPVKVWEFPVRVIHWTNFLAIVSLIVTGIYIHYPFLATAHMPDLFVMGWARTVHFVSGWMLMIGVAGRIIWGIVGNKYAKLRTFVPFTYASGRENLVAVFRYYTLMSPRLPPRLGHNAMASMAYLAIGACMIFQIISGFALFGQYDPAGMANSLFGGIFVFMSNGYVRLIHYFMTYVFIAFAMFHVYAMWMSDIAERDGCSGSMFNGYKYGDPNLKE